MPPIIFRFKEVFILFLGVIQFIFQPLSAPVSPLSPLRPCVRPSVRPSVRPCVRASSGAGEGGLHAVGRGRVELSVPGHQRRGRAEGPRLCRDLHDPSAGHHRYGPPPPSSGLSDVFLLLSFRLSCFIVFFVNFFTRFSLAHI